MKCPAGVIINHVARNIFEDLQRVLRHLVVCLPWVKWGVKLLCVADLSCYVSGRSAGNLVVSSQRGREVEREKEINENDCFESASGRFEPTTPA